MEEHFFCCYCPQKEINISFNVCNKPGEEFQIKRKVKVPDQLIQNIIFCLKPICLYVLAWGNYFLFFSSKQVWNKLDKTVQLMYTRSAVCTLLYDILAPTGHKFLTNHRRALSYLFCSDWSKRRMEKETNCHNVLTFSPQQEGPL